jgi:hypothetical protein
MAKKMKEMKEHSEAWNNMIKQLEKFPTEDQNEMKKLIRKAAELEMRKRGRKDGK